MRLSVGTFPPSSIQDITLKKWLKENGVDVSKVKILPMGPGDVVTAITAGKVDAGLPAPAIANNNRTGLQGQIHCGLLA